MEIYKKTVIILALTLTLLIGVLFLSSQYLLLESYSSLEHAKAEEQTERALSTLQAEIGEINAYAIDWAEWDDTYLFIEDRNEQYLASNIVNETFTNFNLNLMLYLDSNGTVVLARAFDLEKGVPLACATGCVEQVISTIRSDRVLSTHPDTDTGFAGIVSLPTGPMMLASQPIRTSRGEGPVRGTLIMGRYVTGRETAHLQEVVRLPVTFKPWETVPSGLVDGDGTIAVHVTNSSVISGYAVISDVHGNPALLMQVDMARDIFDQGQATLLYFLAWLLVTGLVFGLVTVALLKRQILSRISLLHRGVTTITALRDFATPLPIEGDDEIADFARAVNRMLAEITSSQQELRESRDRYQLLFNSGKDMVFVYSLCEEGRPGRILQVNDPAAEQLAYAAGALTGMPVSRVVDPRSAKGIPESVRSGIYQGDQLIRTELVTGREEKIPVEVTTHRIVLDGQDAVLAIARDITERVKTERELELYRLQLEELVGLRTTELKWANNQLIREIREREATEHELGEYRLHLEEMVAERTNELKRTADELTKEIEERERLEKQKIEAYEQIAKNMEQFAILNDHIRNPLQVIVGIASLAGDETSEKILVQAEILNEIVTRLDQGWIESAKIRAFLTKHYGEE